MLEREDKAIPRVDVWIRKEDWEKWKAIGDKPAFIHDAITVQASKEFDGLGGIVDDEVNTATYDHLSRVNYDGTSSVIIAQDKKDMARLKKAYPGEKIVLANKYTGYPLPKDLKKVLKNE